MFFRNNQKNSNIFYYIKGLEIKHSQPTVSHRTIIWLGEEIHQVNCELNILLVEHGDFISEDLNLFQVFFKNFRTYYYPSKIILLKQFQLNLV
jgi:hypothetical protein